MWVQTKNRSTLKIRNRKKQIAEMIEAGDEELPPCVRERSTTKGMRLVYHGRLLDEKKTMEECDVAKDPYVVLGFDGNAEEAEKAKEQAKADEERWLKQKAELEAFSKHRATPKDSSTSKRPPTPPPFDEGTLQPPFSSFRRVQPQQGFGKKGCTKDDGSAKASSAPPATTHLAEPDLFLLAKISGRRRRSLRAASGSDGCPFEMRVR